MWGQFQELSLFAKMATLVGPVLFVIALWFSLRAAEFSWPNIVVMVVGILCPVLPSIHKLTLSKDTFSFEQFDVAANSKDALEGLQKAAKVNSDAIGALSARVNDLSKITNQNAAPTTANTNYKTELGTISEAAQKIGREVKDNDKTLEDVRGKTDALNRLLIRQAPVRMQ